MLFHQLNIRPLFLLIQLVIFTGKFTNKFGLIHRKFFQPFNEAHICRIDADGLNAFEGRVGALSGAAGPRILTPHPGEAARLLGKYLPYPAITGRLCHHPCESACARRDIDNAVNINGLERYVGDYGLKHGAEHPPRTRAGKAAVIGSGPAGLAAAYFLRRMGFGVTVFEASAEPGGRLREEVRHGRLQRDVLDAQIQFFRDMGVAFRTNTRFGQDVSLMTLGEQLYQSVLLATGPGSLATDPIATDGNGSPVVDPVTQETSAKGVFAGGGLLLDHAHLVKVVGSAKRSTIFMAPSGSSPKVGSSRNITLGSFRRTSATPRRCFIPRE